MILNFKEIFLHQTKFVFKVYFLLKIIIIFATTTFQIKITSIYIVIMALIYWIDTNILH